MPLRHINLFCAGVFLFSLLHAADAATGAVPFRKVIKPWKAEPGAELGFGWGEREAEGATWRWITHLEADLAVELEGGGDVKFSMRAAPMYLKARRQVLGLYVNGVFVAEWLCRDSTRFRTYETVIPGAMINPGRNTLTLRAGYRKSLEPGGPPLAVAVERIDLASP